MNPAVPTKCDVVVVGGGVSGLTAAHRLARINPDLKIVVLEAKDRLGGRTKTVTLQSNKGFDQWDMGGQWVGRTQTHLLALLEDLDIPMYPQFCEGKKVAQLGSAKPFHYRSDLPSFPPLVMLDFAQCMLRLNFLSKRHLIVDPFLKKDAEQLDSLTVAELCRQKSRYQHVRDSAEAAIRTVMGVRPSQISALFALCYGNSGGSFENLLLINGDGSQAFRIKGGAQQISEKLAERIENNNDNSTIKFNEPVAKIVQIEGDNAGADVYTSAGRVLRCARVILAIPPSQANHIVYEPLLPSQKRQLLANFPMGNLIKFVVTYHRPFWREAGYSGEIAARGYVDRKPDEVAPICVTFDATTCNGCPALVGFINQEWSGVPQKQRRDAVLHDLARYYGHDALHCIDYCDKDWSEESFVGGCPVCYLPPGQMSNFAAQIRVPSGMIHWAGTETATHWMGYISGAVEAGERAANEVLHHLSPSLLSQSDLKGTPYALDYRPPTLPKLLPVMDSWLSRALWAVVLGGFAFGAYCMWRNGEKQSNWPLNIKLISNFKVGNPGK